MNFDFLVYKVECSNVSTTKCNLHKGLCVINGDVHQFIGNCLIPLDLCLKIHLAAPVFGFPRGGMGGGQILGFNWGQGKVF